MLYFLIAIVVLVGLCDMASRQSRTEFLLLNFRFRLFEIRDELRTSAITDEVEVNNWFDYLDTTLTKAIDQLPHLTVWQALILFVHYKDDEDINEARNELMKALNQEGNEKFAELYEEYMTTIGSFIFTRHRSMRLSFKAFAKVTNSLINLKSGIAKVLSAAPETSTLLKHCRN